MSKPRIKRSNPIDGYVGGRVRLKRLQIGMSQQKLGEALGVTFQQIQKYEKGVNRIGAGRLLEMADILGVPVGYFFEGAADFDKIRPPAAQSEEDHLLEFMRTKEGISLNLAFHKIEDGRVRKMVVEFVKSLTKMQLE